MLADVITTVQPTVINLARTLKQLTRPTRALATATTSLARDSLRSRALRQQPRKATPWSRGPRAAIKKCNTRTSKNKEARE
jgi:hypothetical protein